MPVLHGRGFYRSVCGLISCRAREGELPWNFVGRDDSAHQNGLGDDLGAPCMPIHTDTFAAMRRRHTRGETQSFSPLANHPISFRARCARKSKSLFPDATRLSGQGKRNGCHPRGTGAHCAPLRQAEQRVPVGWQLPFLLLSAAGRRKVWRHAPCARSAPLFAAANAGTHWAHTYTSALTQKERG